MALNEFPPTCPLCNGPMNVLGQCPSSCPGSIRETKTIRAFEGLPPPKPRACDRCGAPTFERFCEACEGLHARVDRIGACRRDLEMSMPRNFHGLDADDPRIRKLNAQIVDAAFALLEEPFVVIAGPSGAGKTSLAAAMLRARVDVMARPSLFVRAWRLGVARIQHAAGDGEAKSVEEAMGCPHVLLDDVGSERQTATNAVPDVILHRYEEGLPTWVTTWLSPRETAEKYGGGVARRIFEQAKILRVEAVVAPRSEARP